MPVPPALPTRLLPPLRVGTDLVDVRAVEASLCRFGERYVARVYTAEEIAYCASAADSASRFAARFAAKEATLKVLRPVDWRPDWREIEVVREPGGSCSIRLHGLAAALAEREGVQILSCSLAHESTHAIAVVLGLLTPPHRSNLSPRPEHA
jgi:holo-[acyl-carrier protein] synthase